MSKLNVQRLRREIQVDIEEAYASLSGEFTLIDETNAITSILRRLDLNSYAPDIAAQIARAEDHSRASLPMPATAALFTEDIGERLILPLGGGVRVKLNDATLVHLQKKLEHQEEQRNALDDSINRTIGFIADMTVAGMADDLRMTCGDAMRKLGRR